ncbi:hypothetical protein ACW95P_00095 [Candidatus Mycoplasma pogonae]
MENKKRKNTLKYAAVAGGVFSLGIAGVISASLLTQPSSRQKNSEAINQQVLSNVVPLSDKSVNFQISNLENFNGEKFYIKYWDSNLPNPNPQIIALEKTNNENSLNFKLGNLDRRVVYSYQILNSDYKTVSASGIFNTFNIPKVNFVAQKNSINFASETLNEEYYKNKIYLKYWEYRENGEAPEKTSWIAVIAEKNELDDNKQSYHFKGEIGSLKENTPYVIQLSLSGKEGDIDFQSVVYTLGAQSLVKLNSLNTSNTKANINISNLSSLIDLKNNDTSINFYLKYWKNGEANNVKKTLVNLGTQNSVIQELTNLENGTDYQAIFVFDNDNEETVVSQTIDFSTTLVPHVVDFATGINKHKVIISNHNAAARFSGFTSPKSNLNISDMQLVLNGHLGSQWKGDLSALAEGNSTNVFPIESDSEYEFNILDKATSSRRFLESNVRIEKTKFEADFKLVSNTDGKLLYEITDLPTFYKPEEMKLSLKPIGTDGETLEFDLNDFDASAKKATATAENLVPGVSYHIRLLPKYRELNSDRDDLSKYSLINTTFKYEVPGIVTFAGVEGNFLTSPQLKFMLRNLGNDFPLNENLRLQWRIKPKKENVEWETPADNNSIQFNLSKISDDNSYDVILQLANNDKINFAVNEINEVRLVKVSDPSTDLIKAGVKEFNLNTNVNATLFNEEYIPLTKTSALSWQKPQVNNVVGADFTGDNYGVIMERHFTALKTQKQWQDFYGYLAFQGSESEINNFADHVTIATKGYKKNNSQSNYTERSYMIPVSPDDGQLTNYTQPSSSTDYTAKNANLDAYFKAYNYNILLGSYAYDADFTVTPYNPSTFLSMIIWNYDRVTNARQNTIKSGNNKFQNWDSFPFTVYYKLGKYKQIGLAKDNLYLKNNFLTKTIATIPAYTFANEKLLGDFLNFVLAENADEWDLSLVRKSSEDTDPIVTVNDETGTVYAKLQFQNKANQYLSYYGWVKVEGFQAVDKTTKPTQSDLSLASFPETIIGPYYLAKLFKAATDDKAKKAVIEKYFKINKDENIDYVPISLEVDATDDTKAILKVKLVKNGNYGKETYKVESEEIAYELTLNKLNDLPELDLLITGFRGTVNINELEKSLWKVSNNKGRVFDINHSVAELFYKIQEATAKDAAKPGSGAVDAIKNAFKTKMTTSFLGLDSTFGFMYFRAKGERLVSSDYADLTKYVTIIPEEKIGFFMPIESGNTMATDDEKLKLIDYLVKNIDGTFKG